MSSRIRRGRIHPGQRDDSANNTNSNTTDNTADYEILPEHKADIAVTVDHAEKPATRNEHRNRLRRMVDWCITKYPKFAAIGIRKISIEELNDVTKHFHKQEYDFIYERIDPEIIMAFLSTVRKEKDNGTGTEKTRSYSHIRKFHDAILFGAREQGITLHKDYFTYMEKYLKSFKNESVAARRKGDVNELDADPMPFPLYVALSTWNVESGDIFSWCYLVLLWNCMGRSASVDPLGLHNLKLGTDSIIITYDDSKMDSTGEHVHPKNCYANPYCPCVSSFLALGIWCMLYPEQYDATDCLFLKNNTLLGTATKRFSTRLRTQVDNHQEEVKQWSVPSRIKAHSG
jgi:hypothetical protein